MLPSLPVDRIALPAAPSSPARPGFPWAATVAPVVVSLVLWAVTRSVFSLMFAMLGPLVAVGGVVDGRFSRHRAARRSAVTRQRELEQVVATIQAAQHARRDHLLTTIVTPELPAWHDDRSTLPVHVATGTVASAVVLVTDTIDDAAVEPARRAAADPHRMPVIVDARDGIAVQGPPALATAVARAAAVQLASQLTPAAWMLRAPTDQEWVERLPHRVEPGEPGAYEWVSDGGRVVVAWATTVSELPLGCRVRFDLGERALEGPGVVQQNSPVAAVAITAAQAGDAATALQRRAAESGLRPPGSGLPTRVLLRDLLPVDAAAGPGLECVIGSDASGPVTVDLVADGPHALIAGTTGTGKSELLVSWVLAMAHARSADEVSFLLVDFKGGAAFAPLIRLPHVVATLSDLDARLTRRAIESLRAELLRRERVLADAGVRAIEQLPPRTLARLVIVVDEFAAVVAASPDLHEVFADLAARGRSLGLHLVLCTQRPAGVVRDAVLANIGLRISLRVTDRGDSIAMVGDESASRLPADPRGRAILADGSGTLRMAQVALADDVAADEITRSLPAEGGRPWRDPLPIDIALDEIPSVAEGFVFGLVDLPSEQRQPTAVYDPLRHGHLLVVGASASGCTTALTTVAESARRRGVPVVVVSPHPADAWAQLSDLAPGSPATLVIIDDLDALLARYDADYAHELLGRFTGLLRDGPAAGLSFAVSCRRLTSSVAALAGLFGSRLLLRQSSREEHVMAGGEAGSFDPGLAAGSGTYRGAVVQVARSAGAALPSPRVPQPAPVRLAQHPVLAIVAARPRMLIDGLRDRGVRVVRLGRDATHDPASLHVETGPTPTVLLGDPDDWHADWTLLTTARRDWPIAMFGCSLADHRALLRDRDLPPPLSDPTGIGTGECWFSVEGRTVRGILDIAPQTPAAPESEEKRPSNR